MIKKVLFYTSFCLFIFALFLSIISSPKLFFTNITDTLSIWLYYVYPSVFTFYLLASFFINFNIIRKISFIFKPLIYFDSPKSYELFCLSLFVGNPSLSSLTIKELECHNITDNDALKLIKVCAFFNPLFIISLFTIGIINNIKYAYLIIIIIFISNLISHFCFKNHVLKTKVNACINLINPEKILSSINDCLYLLIQIAGVMVFVNIVKFSLLSFFEYLNIKSFILNFIIQNLEISTGAIEILKLNLSEGIRLILVTFLINFQGLSINLQVYNIVKSHIKLKSLIQIRFFQALMSSFLMALLLLIL